MNPRLRDDIYGPDALERFQRQMRLNPEAFAHANQAAEAGALADAEVLVTGWGCPVLDAPFLGMAKNLRLVLYGAGSVKAITPDDFWQSGVRITHARQGNAIPVAEHTLAVILLSLKHFWRLARETREKRAFSRPVGMPGANGSTVGLVSFGAVGRLVCQHLQHHDVKLVVFDPFLSEAEADELGVERVSLDDLFARSHVVSLHTPSLPETRRMIRGRHLASMMPGATLINTARGAVVHEAELIEVLEQRPDLHAILDVTDPEPPHADSRLYDLPNVVLTPHSAGAIGLECRRMGLMMADELDRFVSGQPLAYEVTRSLAPLLA